MGDGFRFVGLVLLLATTRASAALTLDLQLVTGSVSNPVYVTHAGDDSGRLFIVEQNGCIKIFNGTNLLATPFLDISPLTLFSDDEQGLLSVAFHPGYKTNGAFYVYFTNRSGTSNVVARFTASPPGAATVNTNTLQTVLRIPHLDNPNHNGGQMQFGPDGCLYIGTGDGGGRCDTNVVPNNAQNLGRLLGKMLRIDVNNISTNYTIPPGNPFIATNGALPEIWAYGLRNPWRFSFDRLTGDLWIGDVGQAQREEVDLQWAGSEGGQNYGWHVYEGSIFSTQSCPTVVVSNIPAVFPVLEYDHTSGRCALVGGYRYRGSKIAPLFGTYLYADECGGQIYGAVTNGVGGWTSTLLTDTVYAVDSFGEDQPGEIYFSHYATVGAIYKIVWRDTDGDGMADDWETEHGLNPASAADAGLDDDGDGFTNLQEFLANTDPHDPASALRITSIARSGLDSIVSYSAVTSRRYEFQFTDSLTTSNWAGMATNIAVTTGVSQFTDPGAAVFASRFYRVRLVP